MSRNHLAISLYTIPMLSQFYLAMFHSQMVDDLEDEVRKYEKETGREHCSRTFKTVSESDISSKDKLFSWKKMLLLLCFGHANLLKNTKLVGLFC